MKTIIVADDKAIFREPLMAVLRTEGYDVRGATTGRELLETVHRERPDLILLDVVMPALDGVSCLKALRDNPTTQDLPVIVLSAISSRQVVTEMIKLGISAYLLKSHFSLEELLDKVRAHFIATVMEAAPQQPAPTTDAARTPDGPSSRKEPARSAPPSLSRSETFERLKAYCELRATPTVLHHVLSLTRASRSSFDEIADAVRQDQALSLKVMRVANSSFFGGGKSVRTLTDAAQRIGMSGTSKIVATIMAIDHFESVNPGGLIPQRFWEHSLGTAVLADLIGQTLELPNTEILFLGGLLHDIGRLVLSEALPEHYQWVLEYALTQRGSLAEAEKKAFGIDHATATRKILNIWDAPDEIVDIAAGHEMVAKQIEARVRDSAAACAVALANRLSQALLLGDSGGKAIAHYQDYVRALELEPATLVKILRDATRRMEETCLFYASQSGGSLRESPSAEILEAHGSSHQIAVLAPAPEIDPIGVMCGRLGWRAEESPEMAVISAENAKTLEKYFADLRTLESLTDRKLPLLLALPERVSPPQEHLRDRLWEVITLPGRYDMIVEAIERLYARVPTPV